jgi:hypothetical protein
MYEARLPTELWIKAHLRRCNAKGVPAVVARRGDPHSGVVIVKINQLETGCRVLTQARDLDGRMGWMQALDGKLVSEQEADAYIDRQAKRDPDLWVIEVEDRLGRHWFDGKVL